MTGNRHHIGGISRHCYPKGRRKNLREVCESFAGRRAGTTGASAMVCLLLLAAIPGFLRAQVSLSLADCLEQAAREDVSAKNARLDIMAAEAQKKEAVWAWFPTVKAQAFAFKAVSPFIELGLDDVLQGESADARQMRAYVEGYAAAYDISTTYTALDQGYTMAVTLMQPLYAGGRIVNGNRLASLAVDAATLKASMEGRDSRLKVEEAYWQTVSLEEKRSLLHEGLNLADTLYKALSAAVDAGLAKPADLTEIQQRRDGLRSDCLTLEGGIRLSKMNLLNQIGYAYTLRPDTMSEYPYIDSIRLGDRLENPQPPEAYYVEESEVMAQTDEARLLELSVQAKELEKKMALGEALPQLGIGGSYGYGRLVNDPKANGAVFATVSIPLTDWGKTSRKVERLGYEQQKAENNRAYLDQQLLLRARKAWVELETAWQQLQLAGSSVELLQRRLTEAEFNFRAGRSTAAEWMQAQTAFRQGQDKVADAHIAYQKAVSQYQAATGR